LVPSSLAITDGIHPVWTSRREFNTIYIIHISINEGTINMEAARKGDKKKTKGI